MSSEEDYDTSDEDLRDALNGDSTESSSDESNAASHEVRVEVMHKILDHLADLPLRASHSPEVVKTVSHFKEENFMPEGSILEFEEVYPENEYEEDDEELSAYYSFDTKNYRIEVRAFEDETYYYAIHVLHKEDRRRVNSGHVYDTKSVIAICKHLENDEFRQAMLILFEKYGGGSRDQQPRNAEMLEWIVEESELRTTTSGIDP